MTTLITKTVTKICVPLIIIFSISLLLAGHNNPGGGFIGGVMFAVSVSLLYVVYGLRHTKKIFDPDWSSWFSFGLLIASLTAFTAILFGHNLFRSAFRIVHIPFFGEIELVSAGVFDLGVYFVVIGGLLYIFKSVGDDE